MSFLCLYFICREISKCSSLLPCQQLKITGIAVQTRNPIPRPKVFILRNSVEPKVTFSTRCKTVSWTSWLLQSCPIHTNWYGLKLQVYDPYRLANRKRQFSVLIQLCLVSGTLIYITCYSSEGVTAVCRSVQFVRIVSTVFSPYTIGKLYLVSGTYHVLFKRRGHSGLSIRTVCTDRKRSFRSVYDRKITSATTKQTRHACIPLSLSVSDNVTRLERKPERQ